MQLRYKAAIAVGFVGAVVAAAAAFGQAGSNTPVSPVAQGPRADGGLGRAFGPGFAKRVVHSESKIQMPDGSFATMIVDTGKVTSVAGNTVTIRRADEQTVSVTATDATKVRRNGAKAAVGDIQNGDTAQVVQLQQNGVTTVKLIRAFSPDFQPPARGRGFGRARRFFGNGTTPGSGSAPPAQSSPADFFVDPGA